MRTCDEPGCEQPHRARGLCVHHYNTIHRKPNPTAEFGCPVCGTTFVKERARVNRYQTLYCSHTCASRGNSYRAAQVEVYKPQPALHRFI